ncbi:hypothetical protein PMG71_21850 [Roseofilum sp. BLCC_M154]|uniref:Uncharacterized protein n=1 Tax=Roseofilum acuticapitatum BLCC-M154 TaxID=3022444 RepID=A0ABT7AYX6_9CYAN|nr:hypothetical protein [Roseofilum acuticapitatum]MDJ1172075.1 hypothetical protein [Roseofilum acuticapitatum BLCC-M154]
MKPIDSCSSSSESGKDDRLVEFLHQYRPCPPPEAKGLEDQILQEIQSLHPESPRGQRRRKVWFFGAIAASLILGIGGYARWSTQMASQPLSEEEIASLDRFLQTTWEGTVSPSNQESAWVEDPWFLQESFPSTN